MKGLVLNDLHFNHKETKRMYSELHQVLDYIKEHDDLEMLVFAGDYFHSKLDYNATNFFYAHQFFTDIMALCEEKKIIVRMIKGTNTHELNQLQDFKAFENSKTFYNFRVIETVQEETIKGLNFLFVPEEYPGPDYEKYYEPFKKKQYAGAFMHVMFDFVNGAKFLIPQNGTPGKAPVFIYDEWKDAFKNGFIISGHIHMQQIFGNCYYPGAFTRWDWSDISKRGFSVFETDGTNWKVEFIENTEAPKYEVMEVTEKSYTDVKDLKESIDARLKDTDYLKVVFNNVEQVDIDLIKKSYNDVKNMNFNVKSNKSSVINETSNTIELSKYDYIVKRELPLPETIQRFCKEDFGTEIDLDMIKEIISK